MHPSQKCSRAKDAEDSEDAKGLPERLNSASQCPPSPLPRFTKTPAGPKIPKIPKIPKNFQRDVWWSILQCARGIWGDSSASMDFVGFSRRVHVGMAKAKHAEESQNVARVL